MIKPESIEHLKTLIDITEVIGSVVKLKKEGVNMVGLCPFHNEKTPSFTVSKAKDVFTCFGCSKSGDAIDFVKENEHLTYVEALKSIATFYNYELEFEDDDEKKDHEKPVQRLEKLSKKFIDWFESRGISNNTTLRFKITEATEWMPKAKKVVDVICFNYFRDEELINIKFRGPQKDFMLSKNAELIFYNLDAIKDDKTAIIVEGEVDCLSLYEAGFYNVVSVPNGASTGNNRLVYLDNCIHYFDDKEKIILMTDNDEPGFNIREELARRLGKHRCLKVEYPPGCKDANDILLKHNKEKLQSIVAEAKEWPIEGVLTMGDMSADVLNFYEHGYPTGVKMGVEVIDPLISFMPGQLTTITGIPGSGKSEFVDYIMTTLSMRHDWPFAICSFENQPSSLHVTKLMEKFVGKSFCFRKDISDRITKDDFEQSIYLVERYYHFININQVEVTLDGILKKAEELVIRKGIKGLLIDPWNYIEHKIPKGYSETQYISESLTAIKSFCLKFGVHVFLIAHPTKLQKDKQTGKYEVPTLYNISGSAHFFNKTDNGITIYRDFSTNVVDVYVQKVRYSWLGKVGFCTFNYDTMRRSYKQIL